MLFFSKKIFFVLKFFLFCFIFLFIVLITLFVYYTKDLPRPEDFAEKKFVQSTKIYDRTGKVLLYNIYGEEKREIVSLNQIPDHLKKAVLVAEDINFYQHRGIDFSGIIRAILVNIKKRKLIQGGSTITQQLIRSSFLNRKKVIKRKVKEIILTLELERRYSKNQIFEWYLNQIPFGENSYGVEAASQTYFQKPVSEISLSEAAILASLIQAPSYLSPYKENRDKLLERKNYILERMAKAGFISQEEKELAKNEKIKFAKIRRPIKAPHFTLYIKKKLEKKYDKEELKRKGFKVYTTLDWELQKLAEKIVAQESKKNELLNAHNSALVAINPKTGEILAMVGSKNYFNKPFPQGCESFKEKCLFEPKFNVATQGKRQPGSAFKPFVYAAAFKKGYTPQTILWDVKTEFNPNCSPDANQKKDKYGLKCYHPQNYDNKYRGKISLKESLAQSINLTSVKLLYLTGIQNVLKLAKDFGITTLTNLDRYGLSLVLGGGEVNLLEITSAFGVFATEGLKTPAFGILKIEDSEGNIIEENKKNQKRVLNKEIARMINDILSDNQARIPMFGLNSVLNFWNFQVAVKTGTTQNFKDAWTIGYTPSIVVGVWVGNNNNTPMAKKPGVVLAGSVWRKFMEKILAKLPKEKFKKPKTILTGKDILDGKKEKITSHSILYYLDKNNPLGKAPLKPENDPQYILWEEGVKNWLKKRG